MRPFEIHERNGQLYDKQQLEQRGAYHFTAHFFPYKVPIGSSMIYQHKRSTHLTPFPNASLSLTPPLTLYHISPTPEFTGGHQGKYLYPPYSKGLDYIMVSAIMHNVTTISSKII